MAQAVVMLQPLVKPWSYLLNRTKKISVGIPRSFANKALCGSEKMPIIPRRRGLIPKGLVRMH